MKEIGVPQNLADYAVQEQRNMPWQLAVTQCIMHGMHYQIQ